VAEVPAEAALHDLLHDAPEVRGRLVVVLPRAADGDAAHQVPLDEPPDVDRDVALALLELRGDLVERERAALHVEEGEDRPCSWFKTPLVAAAAPMPSTKIAVGRSIVLGLRSGMGV